MRHFIRLGEVDILPLLLQLDRNPQLWDQEAGRRGETSPHRGLGDIWLRYRARDELTEGKAYNEPFFPCVWYPAYSVLTEVRPILDSITRRLVPVALGGTLITRIPPGGEVLPHSDGCSWHANYYNTKTYVTIKSNPRCVNVTAGESLVMQPGECWIFDNLKEHSVQNDGDDDRITLITSMRCE